MKKESPPQIKVDATGHSSLSKNNIILVLYIGLSVSLFFWKQLISIQETALWSISLFVVFFMLLNYVLNPWTISISSLSHLSKPSVKTIFKDVVYKKANNEQQNNTSFSIPLYPLAKGRIKNIEEVDNKLYSEKSLGDGFAVTPVEGKVHSPINGRIVSLFPTKHAIGIKDENNIEYLLHMGIDTVALNGHGFHNFVELNQKVEAGDVLTEMDLNYIQEKHKTTDIIFIALSQEQIESIEIDKEKGIALYESVGKIILK